MEVVPYSSELESAWTSFVNGADSATIAHQIGWNAAMEGGLGHKPRYLVAIDGSRVCGVLPLFLVTTWWRARYLISLPWIDYGGVLAETDEVAAVLLKSARSTAVAENVSFIEYRSVAAASPDLPLRTDKVTFCLALDKDPDRVWKGFNAKLRNQVRKADKSGLVTELGGRENLDEFYGVFCRRMRDLGTPVWGKRFFELIFDAFPSQTQIALVRRHGDLVAGGLVLAFKDRLYIPSAASHREALRYCPNHALYWHVIEYGCREGFRYFDFGRSSVDSATYKFKKQWTPTPTPLTWQYDLNKATEIPGINPSNPRYRLLINLWRRLPLSLANFLGPKVIRNFP